MSEPQATRIDITESTSQFRLGALFDLLIVMAVLVIVKQSILPFSFLYAGPASTFSAMAVATILLRRRGFGWKDMGLQWPDNWLKTAGLTILSMVVFIIAVQSMKLIAEIWFEHIGASGRFDHVEGNLGAYMIIMALTWTHASFFEELLFRAFVINHASRFMGGGIKADWIAVLFSSVFFGYRHYYYQGMYGALVTGAGGFAFGALYLWFGRKNIMPLIFAHGIFNSISQTSRFFGWED